jgi:hypothetical protein
VRLGKEGSFKLRVGWDAVPGAEATDGVVADWSGLPELLKPLMMPELRLESSQLYDGGGPGMAQLQISFKRRSKSVWVRIFVSSRGTAHARAKLLSLVSDTNRMDIPYVRGPEDLGDISLELPLARRHGLRWAFRNVVVDVDVGDPDTGVDVVPIAYLIRDFMTRHLTPDAVAHAPTLDAVEITPSPIRVGDAVRVAVKQSLAAQLKLDDDYREARPALLESLGWDGLALTYIAQAPGNTAISISLVDRKTLLSAWTRVPIEILP